jgi:hypothetical protein
MSFLSLESRKGKALGNRYPALAVVAAQIDNFVPEGTIVRFSTR